MDDIVDSVEKLAMVLLVLVTTNNTTVSEEVLSLGDTGESQGCSSKRFHYLITIRLIIFSHTYPLI